MAAGNLGALALGEGDPEIATELFEIADLAALETFDALRATVWAERARRELGRIGLRPRAPQQLTETGRIVASLAAQGRTNREIAAAAFPSSRTVEGVLARVYATLGIGSRAELGRAFAQDAGPATR